MFKWNLRRLLGMLTVSLSMTGVTIAADADAGDPDTQPISAATDRSPVDLRLTADQKWLVTANQTSHSVSLVETASGRVLDEQLCGKHPAAVALTPDDRTVLVSCQHAGEIAILRIEDNRLRRSGTIDVGFEPLGIAVSATGETAYVALNAAAKVAVIDLKSGSVVSRIEVGSWPRYLDLSPDDSRLAVGCSGTGAIDVIDTASRERLYSQRLDYGINIGHLATSHDGNHVYFPWMMYRANAITDFNIRRGWVLASRIARVRLDGPQHREAISLDVPGLAAADPHGMAISPDGNRLLCTSSGTHELFVYRLPDLPFVGVGGPGDLIDRRLTADSDLFSRIALGGRPMAVRMAGDNRTAYVANYLENAIQVVDILDRKLVRTIDLGGPVEPSLARRGEAVFYDAKNSLDQWYSCHSCHQDGGTNSRPMDTFNDGSAFTMKTVLPLYNLHETAPWTWHGWQTDLVDAMEKSLTVTMLGRKPEEGKVEAMLAYFRTLQAPPNPFREKDGSLTAAAARGQKVFARAGCADCHSGPYFTDGEIHDVGLGSDDDEYQGFNTPSLIGVYRKTRLLHDGRRRSLRDVLTGPHAPEKVNGGPALPDADLADLVEYLKSL